MTKLLQKNKKVKNQLNKFFGYQNEFFKNQNSQAYKAQKISSSYKDGTKTEISQKSNNNNKNQINVSNFDGKLIEKNVKAKFQNLMSVRNRQGSKQSLNNKSQYKYSLTSRNNSEKFSGKKKKTQINQNFLLENVYGNLDDFTLEDEEQQQEFQNEKKNDADNNNNQKQEFQEVQKDSQKQQNSIKQKEELKFSPLKENEEKYKQIQINNENYVILKMDQEELKNILKIQEAQKNQKQKSEFKNQSFASHFVNNFTTNFSSYLDVNNLTHNSNIIKSNNQNININNMNNNYNNGNKRSFTINQSDRSFGTNSFLTQNNLSGFVNMFNLKEKENNYTTTNTSNNQSRLWEKKDFQKQKQSRLFIEEEGKQQQEKLQDIQQSPQFQVNYDDQNYDNHQKSQIDRECNNLTNFQDEIIENVDQNIQSNVQCIQSNIQGKVCQDFSNYRNQTQPNQNLNQIQNQIDEFQNTGKFNDKNNNDFNYKKIENYQNQQNNVNKSKIQKQKSFESLNKSQPKRKPFINQPKTVINNLQKKDDISKNQDDKQDKKSNVDIVNQLFSFRKQLENVSPRKSYKKNQNQQNLDQNLQYDEQKKLDFQNKDIVQNLNIKNKEQIPEHENVQQTQQQIEQQTEQLDEQKNIQKNKKINEYQINENQKQSELNQQNIKIETSEREIQYQNSLQKKIDDLGEEGSQSPKQRQIVSKNSFVGNESFQVRNLDSLSNFQQFNKNNNSIIFNSNMKICLPSQQQLSQQKIYDYDKMDFSYETQLFKKNDLNQQSDQDELKDVNLNVKKKLFDKSFNEIEQIVKENNQGNQTYDKQIYEDKKQKQQALELLDFPLSQGVGQRGI
ncbi:hypothetical protein PPERSA_13127 [Pseudocohnilembus persalinus]|uniref:Uncharacterized protein n=1 Tax=Pseudocohnilembus persalinus TaxID=266149 RepID=A0A0V0QXM5_PSEPJ|nr:hypothetical protein PPERSA_13127 [Pseudocohnilembus persalinus]|eukprot:KRX06648.1 hypothetical protein PPERSA_13127 [Pseudocohnilembus persalinus]